MASSTADGLAPAAPTAAYGAAARQCTRGQRGCGGGREDGGRSDQWVSGGAPLVVVAVVVVAVALVMLRVSVENDGNKQYDRLWNGEGQSTGVGVQCSTVQYSTVQ